MNSEKDNLLWVSKGTLARGSAGIYGAARELNHYRTPGLCLSVIQAAHRTVCRRLKTHPHYYADLVNWDRTVRRLGDLASA